MQLPFSVFADDLDDFIKEVHVSTFDCPSDSSITRVDNYLKDINTSIEQSIKLKVHKAHWLICVGNSDAAQRLIASLLANKSLSESSESYASIHYQLGFIFDVNDDPRKCEYYRKSEQLAKDKFSDIYLSSQLGLITECGKEKQDFGVKLGLLFSLLESYSKQNDKKALAHIHNNIGLLYSSIGQRVLAAEEYEKSYRLGLSVYEEKNQLAPLISIISALTGSGDFDNAKRMIDELGEGNLKVNTPLTNSWYHFALSRHYYVTENYIEMKKSLRTWQAFLTQISNKEMAKLYEWYATALCLNEGNKECVKAFLDKQQDSKTAMSGRFAKQERYLRFLVKAHLFMGNLEAAGDSFDKYVDITVEKMQQQQASGRVLGVANLHNKITGLETNIEEFERKRWQAVFSLLGITLCFALLAYWTVGRAYLRKLGSDPATGLLNEQAVLSKIRKIKSTNSERVNALALINVSNLCDIQSQYGTTESDLLITQLASCLKHATRDLDIVGRVSADQFIVCIQDIQESIAKDSFNRIESALSKIAVVTKNRHNIEPNIVMHVYNANTGLSDVDEVISEIRENRNKAT
ncbi:diguanylate cyclase [uncultured Paraglaciecola sp.]|uniref:diguanylate cyclase domain-containing protein n=1 Tax=uncultured Paraglaciecola sp. TaxID=1765024 RepID=UPI0025978E45|nr:diguanylate cyclase [uncultured Paraglaciecola sp.]